VNYTLYRAEKTEFDGFYNNHISSSVEKMKFSSSSFKDEQTLEELEFWNNISLIGGEPVKYPNDIKFHFPKSPLCDLTKIKSTLTEFIPKAHELEGIGNSLGYLGLPGTYFTLHTEDYDLCSVSYLHGGSPK